MTGRSSAIRAAAILIVAALTTANGDRLACGAAPAASAKAAADHWAFRHLVRPSVPSIQHAEVARTPVDAFLLSELERKGLALSPPADRATLLRRLNFDLIGLPPRPAEIEQFVADPRPDAYPRAVERLLASPHYGERWGKYWLDVAGYADSNGYFNADTNRPFAYRYRDYVIRAFDADKPFDQFLCEQLAGDELCGLATEQGTAPGNAISPRAIELMTATHFLRNGQDGTGVSDGNPDERRVDRATALQGTLQITMNALFGLTIQCCRCHDHKFEPIKQAEYYSLQSVFYPAFPAYDSEHWVTPEKRLREMPTAAERGLWERRLRDLDAKEKDLRRKLAKHPKQLKKALAELKAEREQKAGEVASVTDLLEQPPTLHLLKRGNFDDLGEAVVPAGLAILCDGHSALKVNRPFAGSHSTGRRLAFARWLTDPKSRTSSLVARVMVNRIWQHHFGRGIVATPDNFGLSGSPPTHPQLLEYLADAFRASGWSVKAIHRVIVLSSAYQQSSTGSEKSLSADPNAVLLSRYPLQRLDAEAVRDALLTVSGELTNQLYGPFVATERREDGNVVASNQQQGRRRSVYLEQRRTQVNTFLELFDAPVIVNNCAVRGTSTVPLQSLLLLNSEFVALALSAFARVAEKRNAMSEPLAEQVRRAIVMAFGRQPTEVERTKSIEFLQKEAAAFGAAKDAWPRAWTDYCHMLLASNAFLYVE